MMRPAMRPEIPPMLQRAHELMAAGNYPAAAEAFEKLASRAETNQRPRAGQLYLQAGRACILAGQKEVGFGHLKHGLEWMAGLGAPEPLARMGNRVVRELNEHGMKTEAQAIADWLKSNLPAGPAAPGAASAPARKPILPTRCPGCGGPIDAEDVEWTDEVTAECNWCGSPVRAEK
jgi:hypothetical protein